MPARIIPTLYEGRYPGLAGRDGFGGSSDSHPLLKFEGAHWLIYTLCIRYICSAVQLALSSLRDHLQSKNKLA